MKAVRFLGLNFITLIFSFSTVFASDVKPIPGNLDPVLAACMNLLLDVSPELQANIAQTVLNHVLESPRSSSAKIETTLQLVAKEANRHDLLASTFTSFEKVLNNRKDLTADSLMASAEILTLSLGTRNAPPVSKIAKLLRSITLAATTNRVSQLSTTEFMQVANTVITLSNRITLQTKSSMNTAEYFEITSALGDNLLSLVKVATAHGANDIFKTVFENISNLANPSFRDAHLYSILESSLAADPAVFNSVLELALKVALDAPMTSGAGKVTLLEKMLSTDKGSSEKILVATFLEIFKRKTDPSLMFRSLQQVENQFGIKKVLELNPNLITEVVENIIGSASRKGNSSLIIDAFFYLKNKFAPFEGSVDPLAEILKNYIRPDMPDFKIVLSTIVKESASVSNRNYLNLILEKFNTPDSTSDANLSQIVTAVSENIVFEQPAELLLHLVNHAGAGKQTLFEISKIVAFEMDPMDSATIDLAIAIQNRSSQPFISYLMNQMAQSRRAKTTDLASSFYAIKPGLIRNLIDSTLTSSSEVIYILETLVGAELSGLVLSDRVEILESAIKRLDPQQPLFTRYVLIAIEAIAKSKTPASVKKLLTALIKVTQSQESQLKEIELNLVVQSISHLSASLKAEGEAMLKYSVLILKAIAKNSNTSANVLRNLGDLVMKEEFAGSDAVADFLKEVIVKTNQSAESLHKMWLWIQAKKHQFKGEMLVLQAIVAHESCVYQTWESIARYVSAEDVDINTPGIDGVLQEINKRDPRLMKKLLNIKTVLDDL